MGVYARGTTTRLETGTRDDETIDVAMLGPGELVSLTAAGIDRWTVQPNARLSLTTTLARRGLTHIAATPTLVAAADDSHVFFYSTANGELEPNGSLLAGGSINAMTFHGDTLVLAVESVAVELIDPTDPTTVVPVPEPAKDLAVVGDTLYLASGGSGLVVISLAGTPHVVDRLAAGEANLTRIAASGSRVYAVEHHHTVPTYNATNPPALVPTRTLASPPTS